MAAAPRGGRAPQPADAYFDDLRALATTRFDALQRCTTVPPALLPSYAEAPALRELEERAAASRLVAAAAEDALHRAVVEEGQQWAVMPPPRTFDTSFRTAHEAARGAVAAGGSPPASVGAPPDAGGCGLPGGDAEWDIDVLRAVVDAAAGDLAAAPLPAVMRHQPYIRGLPPVSWDDVDAAVYLVYGLVRYHRAGVEALREVVNELRADFVSRAGPAGWGAAFAEEVQLGALLNRLRDKQRRPLPPPPGAPGNGAGAAAGSAVSQRERALNAALDVVTVLQRLQSWHGPSINSLDRVKHMTYGRFFTGPAKLRALAGRLRERGRLDPARDVYVDFSCGTNEFGALLGLRRWFGVDIYIPATHADSEHFVWANWFDVQWLPPKAVIGLNPPFGAGGELAERFINRALQFRPRLLALIVPETSVRWRVRQSNEWRARLARLAAEQPGLRSWRPTRADEPHPALAACPPPEYVLVDYSASEIIGASFYMPGSLLSQEAVRRERAAAAAAAAGGGAGARDLSGDYSFQGGGGGGGGGGGSGSSAGAAAAAGGDAAAVCVATAESMAQRGIPIKPEDQPSWFLFAAGWWVTSPDQVVPGPGHL